MEMPDKICIELVKVEKLGGYLMKHFDTKKSFDSGTEYHHSRIVEALKAENEAHKKAYWDLLESWSDLRVKYSIAVDELVDIKAKPGKTIDVGLIKGMLHDKFCEDTKSHNMTRLETIGWAVDHLASRYNMTPKE